MTGDKKIKIRKIKSQQKLLASSVLCCRFEQLKEEMKMLNESQTDLLHLDIMDGVFVPNLSFGYPIIECVAKYSKKTLEAHLMVVNPETYIKRLADLGVKSICVHWEACTHLDQVIKMIHEQNCSAGIAINPHTPVSFLQDILHEVEYVCLMSVNPGYARQHFIEYVMHKIQKVKKIIVDRKLNTLIEVDGGVNFSNVERVLQVGADVIISASAIFDADKPIEAIQKFKSILSQANPQP